jgi:hypothetical protein
VLFFRPARSLNRQNLRPRRDPFELAGEAGPEGFRIPAGTLVDAFVGDDGGALKLGGRRKAAVFLKECVDFRHEFKGSSGAPGTPL